MSPQQRQYLNDATEALSKHLGTIGRDELEDIRRRHMTGTLTQDDREAMHYEAAQQLDIEAEKADLRSLARGAAIAMLCFAIGGDSGVNLDHALATYRMFA